MRRKGLVDDEGAVGVEVVRLGEVPALGYLHAEEADEVGIDGQAVHLDSLALVVAAPAHLALGDHAVAGEGDVGDVGVLEEYLPEGLAAVA